MKKNTNKKGFTIVELVIVVAVIAILAAVMIPTFSSIKRKADIASDTAVVRNLNVAAISENADTFDEALEAVKGAGYLVANLNAKASDCFVVWEDDTNQFLLYDLSASKIIYSNTTVSGNPDNSWYFAISNSTVAASVKTRLPAVNIKNTVSSFNDLNTFLTTPGTQTVYMDESVVFSGSNNLSVAANADVTLNLGNSSVSTNGTLTKTPVFVEGAGKLTVNGGNVGGSGNVTNEYGTFTWAVCVDGNGQLVLNNTTIKTEVSGVCATQDIDGDAYIELNNCTIEAGKHAVSMSCGQQGGKAVLNNVTATASWTLFASQGSVIEVNSGNYTSDEGRMFYVQDANTKIVIRGGKFNGKDFSELTTVDDWKALFKNQSNAASYKVVIANNGEVTISL